MPAESHGRGAASKAVIRSGLALAALLAGFGLSACTTVEGTNALTDVGTFEREVMDTTLVGVGLIDKPERPDDPTNNRGPLVIPKAGVVMPPPEQAEKDASLLPQDSDKVEVNTAGLSADDLKRLRNAKVVDANTMSGRPLTQAEMNKLVANMKAYEVSVNTKRPLYMPPASYFTTVQGEDLVCLAKNGDLVPVSDPACPPEIRKALLQKSG
ncbi:MAG TPA: hypothetical protein VFO41_17595 [Alphaproteobacteria bacterium]|nr:hypothetical protein [Alphaproteobacteria bacterium]